MGAWHEGRIAMFDTETSGTSSHLDRIVSAAIIEGGGGHKTVTRNWLINPGIDIPEGATAIHGITTEDARTNGRPAVTAIRELAMDLLSCSRSGLPIVGHNVGFDLTILYAELVRYGHTALANGIGAIRPVVDTMVIEKHLDPYRPGKPNGKRPDEACGSHKLIDCCRLWGVPLTEEEAHGAAADALAAGRLAWRLATNPERFAEFDTRPLDRINPAMWPLDKLHQWQAEQYAKSALSYQAYKRGEQRGKPADGVDPEFVANTEWPVQPLPADWSPELLPEAVAS